MHKVGRHQGTSEHAFALLLFAAIMLLLLCLSFSVICLFAHYLFIVTIIVVCVILKLQKAISENHC